jgi:hypothetical protein
MEVFLRVLRHVAMDDMADIGDVQTARGEAGGDEGLEAAQVERGVPMVITSIWRKLAG